MNAIVIGAGIGGLTAVIAMQKPGIDAHLYERAAALREIGAGIALWANAIHALDELGLSELIRARIVFQHESDVRSWRGTTLFSITSEELERRYDVTVGAIHRAELLELLLREVDPSRLHLDHQFTGLSQDESEVTARFLNQNAVSGDVLLGADGLHSAVRAQLFSDAPPRYAGYTAW